MKVSIIIPIYNVENYIWECLNSVANQRARCEIECILIDDCSSDGSRKIVDSFLKAYKGNIKFSFMHNEKNLGQSATRNRGIKIASGDYLYFLDSDDFITEDAILKLYQLSLKYPDAELICGDIDTFPQRGGVPDLQLKNKVLPEYIESDEEIRRLWLDFIPVAACNKLIKNDWFKKNDLYYKEGIINEDNHWMYKSYGKISKIAICNEIIYNYRWRAGSTTSILSKRTGHEVELNIIEILADAIGYIVDFDLPIERVITLKMIYLRSFNGKEEKRIFKKLINAILRNKKVGGRLKLLSWYLMMPRPFMRYSIAESLGAVRALNEDLENRRQLYCKM